MTHATLATVQLAVLTLFFALMAAEMLLVFATKRGCYSWYESLATLGIKAGEKTMLAVFAVSTVPLELWLWSHRLLDLPQGGLIYWLALFLGVDFCYYWNHRMSHKVAWMWAAHSVHHSAVEINMLANFRVSAINFLAGNFLFFLPLTVIGFHPLAIATVFSACLLHQAWVHTELVDRMSWLEHVLNTPSNHRVHHSTQPAHIDRNYAGVLVIWDKLFGTYVAEGERIRDFGIVGAAATINPLRIVFSPWLDLFCRTAAAPGVLPRLRVLFGPPDSPAPARHDTPSGQEAAT